MNNTTDIPTQPKLLTHDPEYIKNLKPREDYVLIVDVEPDETAFGRIVIPDTAQQIPQIGFVFATGPGCNKLTGDDVISPGDMVVYGKYSGIELRRLREKYLFIRASDIICRFQRA